MKRLELVVGRFPIGGGLFLATPPEMERAPKPRDMATIAAGAPVSAALAAAGFEPGDRVVLTAEEGSGG